MIEPIANLQHLVDQEMAGGGTKRVLEAGCGSTSRLNLGDNVYIVGIDISEKQLQRNASLDETILGDIQTYDLPASSFDMIISWDVLEHLSEPEQALHRFTKAAAVNGIIVLKIPNVLSLKGLLTKFTPHSVHVLAYRYIFGWKNAGQDDVGPFKTYLRFSIAPQALKKFASRNGLNVVHVDSYDAMSTTWLQQRKIVYIIYRSLRAFMKLISLGYIGDSEFIIVLKRV